MRYWFSIRDYLRSAMVWTRKSARLWYGRRFTWWHDNLLLRPGWLRCGPISDSWRRNFNQVSNNSIKHTANQTSICFFGTLSGGWQWTEKVTKTQPETTNSPQTTIPYHFIEHTITFFGTMPSAVEGMQMTMDRKSRINTKERTHNMESSDSPNP